MCPQSGAKDTELIVWSLTSFQEGLQGFSGFCLYMWLTNMCAKSNITFIDYVDIFFFFF